jgi:aspartate aminotransferase, cytoplasmic
VGIKPVEYPYYNPATIGLDIDGLLGSFRSAPARSIFLLHACAHNPTGVDPTKEQWEKIAEVMLEKKHYAFFDCAYQGFASGNLEADAWAVRFFLEKGVPMLVCQVSITCLPFFRLLVLTAGAELCEKCRAVWGASWRAASYR